MKLARIAVAVAARTFSTDTEGKRVIVRPIHVSAAVEFLDMVYGMESFGYLRHSRRLIAQRRQAQENKLKVEDYLRDNPGVVTALEAVGNEPFRPRDFSEFGANLDQYEAQVVVTYLVEHKMVARLSKGYMRKERALNQILEKLSDEKEASELGE
jgi:hypothetical protein